MCSLTTVFVCRVTGKCIDILNLNVYVNQGYKQDEILQLYTFSLCEYESMFNLMHFGELLKKRHTENNP